MHEISLLESVLETLKRQAQQQNFRQIRQVTLEIGALSCVEADALRFGFDVVMKGSLAESAELNIITIKGQGCCPHCQALGEMETLHDSCSQCGGFGMDVIAGDSMKIKELLVI